jgi:hypothetical protein
MAQPQRSVVFRLIRWLHNISAGIFDRQELSQLKTEICSILWEAELFLPVYFLTISMHLMLHLPATIEDVGPVYCFWLFPTERWFYLIHSSLHSCKVPEATILREYQILDLVHRFKLDQAARAREEDPEAVAMSSLFCSPLVETALLGTSEDYRVSGEELELLTAYVHDNFQPYLDLKERYEAACEMLAEPVPLMKDWRPSHGEPPLSRLQELLIAGGVAIGGRRFRFASINGTELRGAVYEQRLKSTRSGVQAVWKNEEGELQSCYGKVQGRTRRR